MSLVSFVSGRSPGLTTAVHALAVAWPADRRSIVAELDPAGGTLAARYELPPEPGLTNLAAAGRRGLNHDTVIRHCRRLPGGVIALIAPVSPDRVASALAVLGSELAEVLDSIPGTDVLADCGRVDRRSPALEVVRASPFVVLVVTPSLEGVAHAQARLEALSLPAGRLAVVTVGDRPYQPADVGAALQLPVLGALAHDPVGAAQVHGPVGVPGASARRRHLHRSASAIAAQLANFLPALTLTTGSAPEPGSAPESGSPPHTDSAPNTDSAPHTGPTPHTGSAPNTTPSAYPVPEPDRVGATDLHRSRR
jgi:hypothetical protein